MIGAIVFIILMLFLLQKFQLLQPLKDTVTTSLSPIGKFFNNFAHRVQNVGNYFQNNHAIAEENIRLKNDIAQLEVEKLSLQTDLSNSGLLKEELAFIQFHQLNSVPVKVIGVSSDNYSKVIIIDRGRNAGIQVGYPVIVSNGILIGKISSVDSNISKILLLNDNHSQISAIVQNESKSPGVISGQYTLSLHMDLIPQDQLIQKDQVVTTSGLEEFIPANLIIGKISSFTKKEGELFQQATIEPSTSYQTLSIASVIIPTK